MGRKYLGSGIRFPITLERGKVVYTDDTSLINQSVHIILSTPVRNRIFVPEFGSRLSELVFEPNDEVLEDLLTFFINEALENWEKRIKLLKVQYTRSQEDKTDCTITYRVLSSNQVDSTVFPFYKKIKF